MTTLFLPRLNIPQRDLTPEAEDKHYRNLLYVGLTRAMEHLNVFMKEEPGNGVLAELKGLMEG